MAAARARWRFLALLLAIGSSRGLDPAPKPPVPKAISVSPSLNLSSHGLIDCGQIGADAAGVGSAVQDLRDAIVKGLGLQSEELKVSGFDVRDALVGQAVAYEFDMEVGRNAVPVRLLEDVSRWDFVDLPIFRSQADADDTALAEIGRRGARGSFEPTLPPFQLAGPMELWIQDGDDVRLALPVRAFPFLLYTVILKVWAWFSACEL
jgi:hypothetical protein